MEFCDLVLSSYIGLLSSHLQCLLLKGLGNLVFALLMVSHCESVQQQRQFIVLDSPICFSVTRDSPLQVFDALFNSLFVDAVLTDIAEQLGCLAVVLLNR